MKNFTPGEKYRISLKYPPRFIVTNRGKIVEWASGFNGSITGIFSHFYQTHKECFDETKLSSCGTPMNQEWEYWNNSVVNPNIEKFWDWAVFKDSNDHPINVPVNFITSVEEYVGWKKS